MAGVACVAGAFCLRDNGAHVGQELIHHQRVAIRGDVDVVTCADGADGAIRQTLGVCVATFLICEDGAGIDVAYAIMVADSLHKFSDFFQFSIPLGAMFDV